MIPLLPPHDLTSAIVGVSGGADSLALVHYLANHTDISLTAIYVNHNINPNSTEWGEHCAGFCQQIGVPFVSVEVKIDSSRNVEGNARKARYNVFRSFEQDLIIAHHLNDNIETFMLKALRGAGVFGLKSMRPVSYFGNMRVFRPFLNIKKEDILNYCEEHKINYITDPSNHEDCYLRNMVRKKFSDMNTDGIRRSILALQDAEHCLEDLAITDLQNVTEDKGLNIEKLRKLKDHRIRNVIYYFLKINNLSCRSDQLVQFCSYLKHVDWSSSLELSCRNHENKVVFIKQKSKFIKL